MGSYIFNLGQCFRVMCSITHRELKTFTVYKNPNAVLIHSNFTFLQTEDGMETAHLYHHFKSENTSKGVVQIFEHLQKE